MATRRLCIRLLRDAGIKQNHGTCVVVSFCDLHSPCTTGAQTSTKSSVTIWGTGRKTIPQGSEIDHDGLETARMKNTKPFEGLGESQDAKNDQVEFHRHRTQATLRTDNTEITASERLRKSC